MNNLREIITSIESNNFDILAVGDFYSKKYPCADYYLLNKGVEGETFIPPKVEGQTSLLISRLQVDYQKICNELGMDKIPEQVSNFYDINGIYSTDLGELFILATDNYIFKEDYDYTSRLKKVYRELAMLDMNLSIADLLNEKIRDSKPTTGTYHSNLNLNRYRILKKHSKKISKKDIKTVHLICINRYEVLVDVDYSNSEIDGFNENNCDVEKINMTLHHEIGHLHFLKNKEIKKIKKKSVFKLVESGGWNSFGKNAEESFCDSYGYISTLINMGTMNVGEKEYSYVQESMQDEIMKMRWVEDPQKDNVCADIHHTYSNIKILFSALSGMSVDQYKNIDKLKISMFIACIYGEKYKSLNLIKEQDNSKYYVIDESCFKLIEKKLRYPTIVNKIKDFALSYLSGVSVLMVIFPLMYSIMLLTEDMNIFYVAIIYSIVIGGFCYSMEKFNPFEHFLNNLSKSNCEINSTTKFIIQNELIAYMEKKKDVDKKSPIIIDYEMHVAKIKALLV